MKRRMKMLSILMLLVLTLSACGKKDKGIEENLEFLGDWQCQESPLEQPDYYTGYLVWSIQQDGSFTMYDAEAGNPGISGSLEITSDSALTLNCDMEEDFDPPVTWANMEEVQEITYKFVSQEELHVTFEDGEESSTLVFMKMEEL